VFVESYVSLRSYKGRSPFLHWLRKIAVRVGYRFWKEQVKARTQPLAFSIVGPDVEQVAIARSQDPVEAREFLEEVLKLLKPRDRLVLTLLYWDECTVAEAAELCGWTRTMVKVQAHRARNRLRTLLEELNDD
ncbi:MAG: RNA polymerase sigma factor, partial [Planctomycetales bacterium]|nr:RNA polymerase sigma factor [Planctomycetales bacterium]